MLHDGRLLARRAAEADAYSALLDTIGRLEVTPGRRLNAFLEAKAAIRAAVQTALRQEATLGVEFAPDRIAVVRVSISMRALLRILMRVHTEHYEGDQFAAADFRTMALRVGDENLTAAGLAAPPAHTLVRRGYALTEYNTPAWATGSLTAGGRYVPADGETLDETTLADAARLDALDQLRQKVEGLVIQNKITVSEFLGYHQDLKSDVVLLLSGAHPNGQPRAVPDGGLEVQVELPLGRLWEILRRAMTLEEVEPPPVSEERAAARRDAPAIAKEAP